MQKKIEIESLTSAFRDFTSITDKLQASHEILQKKVDFLNEQLEKKNSQLLTQIQKGDTVQNFLNSILENIYTGVIVIDRSGTITIFNKAAEKITGYSKENVIGKNYVDLFGSDSAKQNKSALYTLTTGKEFHHRQKTIQTLDGREKDIEFSTSIIKDNLSNFIGIAEIFNDISELKELQEKIMHIETLAALGEMAASVAHEIRNPLGGIGGFAGLLDRQLEKDDPRRKLIKPIIVGVTRLNNIVSNLLTFTRPQKLNVTKVNLNKTIKEIIDFFEISLENLDKKIDLKVCLSEMNPDLFLDVQLFQQVLMNILKNAYDAIDDQGCIELNIKTQRPDIMNEILDEDEIKELVELFSVVDIEVKDSGLGISSEHMAKLFNPFFTTKDSGNGLGLAICKKIINLHKGDIHVESELNKGTSFHITLPLYETYE